MLVPTQGYSHLADQLNAGDGLSLSLVRVSGDRDLRVGVACARTHHRTVSYPGSLNENATSVFDVPYRAT